ncbi:MAG: hypothetical protein E3J35_06225 [Methanomassiliicoccales archaeon]|nr:MAG: hypothetical protein E3J35_06225 [Methanomassiliicoccales archaeon]
MKSKKSTSKRSFRFYYYIFLCIEVLILAALLAVELLVPSIPDALTQAAALAFGVTLTAFLTTMTYDYISRTTQKREWNRKDQKSIYLPMYEELKRDKFSVERYEYPSTMRRDSDVTVNETILEVINPSYLEILKKHVNTHNGYTEARLKFVKAIDALVRSYHQKLFPEGSGRLNDILRGDHLYLAGLSLYVRTDHLEEYASQFNILKERYAHVTMDPTTAIQVIKGKVESLSETGDFISAHSTMVESTKNLFDATSKEIQELYQI